ncbi:MAG: hypothetical protein GF411_09420 [Candidatus Lokiarchaeota archaeon]|nr:hypothetical protein [Candidatus Lokiarchaeota archaeon]
MPVFNLWREKLNGFLLPFKEGNTQLVRFSPTAIFIASIATAIIISTQTDPIIVVIMLTLLTIGGTIARTRWRIVIRLVARFELVILFWIFFIPFLYGETLLFAIPTPFGLLNTYTEGLELGILFGIRMLTLITLFTAALSHMTLIEFIQALRTLRIPISILGSLLIMLRYIPVFIAERSRMQDAQELRGLDRGTRARRILSMGYMVGSTIDRALDRSMVVYDAMTLRGFGRGTMVKGAGFRNTDVILGFVVVLLVLFVHHLDPSWQGVISI